MFSVPAQLTSALVPEVWEEDVLLGEDKQAQPASGQGVIVNGTRVGQDLPALVHHHPARDAQQAGERHCTWQIFPLFIPAVQSERCVFGEQIKHIHPADCRPLIVTRPDCRP